MLSGSYNVVETDQLVFTYSENLHINYSTLVIVIPEHRCCVLEHH